MTVRPWCRDCNQDPKVPVVPCGSACDQAHAVHHARRKKNYHLRHRHGITLAQYEALVVTQGGACVLCGVTAEQNRARGAKLQVTELAVDHDHATGVVRGLLCFHCNAGLGHFKDNVQTLARAIDYLTRSTRT